MAEDMATYKKRRDLAIARGTWQAWGPADGTRRRLQALAARGWSLRTQARMSGMHRDTLVGITAGRTVRVKTATARAIRAIYDQLWDAAPPTGTHAEAQAASRARNEASRRGWLPPLAWDDDLIDLPDEELEAECARQVAMWDRSALSAAYNACYRQGDRSPLMVAGASEYRRRARDYPASA